MWDIEFMKVLIKQHNISFNSKIAVSQKARPKNEFKKDQELRPLFQNVNRKKN